MNLKHFKIQNPLTPCCISVISLSSNIFMRSQFLKRCEPEIIPSEVSCIIPASLLVFLSFLPQGRWDSLPDGGITFTAFRHPEAMFCFCVTTATWEISREQKKDKQTNKINSQAHLTYFCAYSVKSSYTLRVDCLFCCSFITDCFLE